MDALADQVPDDVARALEREMRLVREAIDLVASGGSPQVIVAGLQLGAQLLDSAQAFADEAGLRLIPLEGAIPSRIDIAIRAVERA